MADSRALDPHIAPNVDDFGRFGGLGVEQQEVLNIAALVVDLDAVRGHVELGRMVRWVQCNNGQSVGQAFGASHK